MKHQQKKTRNLVKSERKEKNSKYHFKNECRIKKLHKLHTDKMSKYIFTQKRINYDKLHFLTKQRKLNFHLINIHTQGYITLNTYIIGIAII